MCATQGSGKQCTPHTNEDGDLENRIINFLHHRHVPSGKQIRAEAHLGRVVVSGKLPSKNAKWLCIECCRRVAGVVNLVDQVVVDYHANSVKPIG